jgi:hypothetical protein
MPFPLLLPLLSKYWLHLLAAAAIVLALTLAVRSIRQDAVQDNNAEWVERMQKMDEAANKTIADIRAASTQLAISAQNNTSNQTKAINAAVSKLKVTPQTAPAGTFVKADKDGVCKFTAEYTDSILNIRNSLPAGPR